MPTQNIPEVLQALAAAVIQDRSEGRTAGGRASGDRQTGSRRTALLSKEQLRVFRRDGFTCRYCAKRTLFIAVLRALSTLYPDKLPYHPHWRWEVTHPVYWTHGCSRDHVVPVCRGGSSAAGNW